MRRVVAAAPTLLFYYHHILSMTGVQIPASKFLRSAKKRMPNLAGGKFTYGNLMAFAECIQLENGRFDALFGRDQIQLAGLSLGANGAIRSTHNFAAPVGRRNMQVVAPSGSAAAQ